MPNIDETISSLKEKLKPNIKSILPSRGIPSSGGNAPSSLTTWTEIKIYPKGMNRPSGPNRGTRVAGSDGNVGETWVLPLPQDLTDVHSMQYETSEFGALASGVAKGIKDFGGMKSFIESSFAQEFSESGFNWGSAGWGPIGEEVLGYLNLDQMINFIRAQRRQTVNPNLENLFKTSNLRTFQFSWSITPLSASDSSGVSNFVSSIKKNMYPTNIAAAYAWNRFNYPSEFQLTFYSSGLTSGAKPIFSTAACACTDLTIGYTPNGAFHTHTDGKPTTVTINGTFQELYTLDSVDIGSM